ncbi:MAG: DUF2007 domain-containing protein [Chloroflexi bacterium]|nr:DUF2007 domain-containing protein [Chloroflexota bacterium]
MFEREWVRVDWTSGDLQAEILRGLLEAQGIPARLSQEGAGKALGLTVGPLGEVEILVAPEDEAAALQVLADYRDGKFEAGEEGQEGGEPQVD